MVIAPTAASAKFTLPLPDRVMRRVVSFFGNATTVTQRGHFAGRIGTRLLNVTYGGCESVKIGDSEGGEHNSYGGL
jgi:hypothetical protein